MLTTFPDIDGVQGVTTQSKRGVQEREIERAWQALTYGDVAAILVHAKVSRETCRALLPGTHVPDSCPLFCSAVNTHVICYRLRRHHLVFHRCSA